MSHQTIQDKILGMLANLGYDEREVSVELDEKTNTLWFAISSPNTRLLFTRNAEALSALNHLATKIAENVLKEGADLRVVVDANDHEKKKIESLRTIAHMMAERARYFKSSIDLDPMPPHERRIIHEFLAEATDVQTESAGTGNGRHIVIRYTGSI